MPSENSTTIEWRTAEDWPNYEVSNLGVIRRKRNQRVLKEVIERGYARVYLHKVKGDRGITTNVHRVVTQAFFGRRPTGMTVNHLDGVKTNNAITNLEYCTMRENLEHASRMGLLATGKRNGAYTHPECIVRGEDQPNSVLTEDSVRLILLAAQNKIPHSVTARKIGVSRQTVSRVAHGERWKHVTLTSLRDEQPKGRE